MIAAVAALVGFLFVLGSLVAAVGAWFRAEEARAELRQVQQRLAAVEKQLGIERPRAARAAATPAPEASAGAARPAPEEGTSLEERIALAWLARVGVVLLAVGGLVFLIYAPGGAGAGRLGLAAAFGLAALAFAEVTRRRARPLFNQAVLGLAVAILQFAALASHPLYQLASAPLAFAGAVAVFAVGCLTAVRHDTEVPLVLTLAGALAAPSILWRGAWPGALFCYLLALGGVAMAVALRRGFRIAFWLVPLGTTAALGVWWVRAGGVSGLEAGLAARVLPLAAAAAFAALWVGGQLLARRPGREGLAPHPFLVAALLLAHLLFAGVAWDQPPVLNLAFAALALAAVRLTPGEMPVSLGLPLLLSFALLLGADHSRAPALATFVPLAVWGAAYASAMLRAPGRLGLVLSGIAGVLFLVVAGELLAPFRWRAFGLVTVLWSFAYAWAAMKRRAPMLLAGTGLVAFAGLAGAAWPLADRGDPVLLGLAGGWVLVHLGGLAYRMRTQRETPEWSHIAAASGAGVSYGLLVLLLAPHEPLVRGALAAATGAAHVLLGGLLLERSPRAGNAIQAVAVGLFAASAMHVLPGAYSTLAWAGLATLLVYAGFRRRSRLLRALGLGLFAVTIARVAVYDLWQRPLQVGVLLAVGAMLLGASWLYARLGARLGETLRQAGRGAPPSGSAA